MDTDVPRMPSVKNLHSVLDAIQKAAVPDAFGVDFLKDMGFTSSNDRSVIKLLKFLGLLDSSGKPQSSYREFVDPTKSRAVLASRVRAAYDDLYAVDSTAHSKPAKDLTGWFKTKTGVGLATAEKMATTFKSLGSYADFDSIPTSAPPPESRQSPNESPPEEQPKAYTSLAEVGFGLTYRIEVHLPDTTNVDTFRAIFRALREELMS